MAPPMILVAICLCALWIGSVAYMLCIAWSDRSIIQAAFALIILAFGVGLAWGLLDTLSRKDRERVILLSEDDWSCTRSETIIHPVMIGRVIVNQPQAVCTEYTRGDQE